MKKHITIRGIQMEKVKKRVLICLLLFGGNTKDYNQNQINAPSE